MGGAHLLSQNNNRGFRFPPPPPPKTFSSDFGHFIFGFWKKCYLKNKLHFLKLFLEFISGRWKRYLQGSYFWEEGHFTGVLLEDEAL